MHSRLESLVNLLKNCGYSDIILKSDQEPSILALKERYKASTDGEDDGTPLKLG